MAADETAGDAVEDEVLRSFDDVCGYGGEICIVDERAELACHAGWIGRRGGRHCRPNEDNDAMYSNNMFWSFRTASQQATALYTTTIRRVLIAIAHRRSLNPSPFHQLRYRPQS